MHAVREKLVVAAGGTADRHDCVLIQGAGTHAIESVLGSVLADSATPEHPPSRPKVLILSNGAYGERQKLICETLRIPYESIDYSDDQAVSARDLDQFLQISDAANGPSTHSFTHLSLIHHETTAGVINPLTEICALVTNKYPHLDVIVDSMSAFGAYEVDLAGKHAAVKYLVSSANKCVEGVPGFAFALYDKFALEKLEGKKPKSVALDLYGQAKGLTTGSRQFRFTPPTQAILGFHQALVEWEQEGGWRARGGRYQANYEVIKRGCDELGLDFYVPEAHRGIIITTVLSPSEDPSWDFPFLYDYLQQRGFVIYPGKLAKADSFRIGSIGKIYPEDCENFVLVLKDAFAKMGIASGERRKEGTTKKPVERKPSTKDGALRGANNFERPYSAKI
eukprot:g11161.t1